ncbi:hypothetical protein B1218_36210, partial [Pseudomonas ogarae]
MWVPLARAELQTLRNAQQWDLYTALERAKGWGEEGGREQLGDEQEGKRGGESRDEHEHHREEESQEGSGQAREEEEAGEARLEEADGWSAVAGEAQQRRAG